MSQYTAIKRIQEMDMYGNKLPFFVKRPQETYILSLSTGIITARITGTPKPEVTWLKNWQTIKDGSRFKTYHYEPDIYVLEIQDALTTDMGLYTCCARNEFGSVKATVTVHVVYVKNEKDPQFVEHLYNTDVLSGQKCQLKVKVVGAPEPEVKWFKNWSPLENNKRIETRHYPPIYILNICNAQVEDSGLYICKARNGAGAVYTTAVINVKDGRRSQVHDFKIPRSYDYWNENLCHLYNNKWLDSISYVRRHLQRMAIEMKEEVNKKDLKEKKTFPPCGRPTYNFERY